MKPGFLLFALVPLLGNVYVMWHVAQLLPVPTWGKWSAVAVMTLLFAGLFVAMGRGLDRMPMPTATLIYEASTSWLILLLYLFLLFLVADVLRLCHLLPSRLLHDSWAGTLCMAGLLTALLAYGNWHYHHKERHTLTLTTRKPLQRPLKLVLLSDLHLGYHNRRADLRRWVDLINGEHADAILVAGDLIDRSVRPLIDDQMDLELLRLNAPVVACLGNHEYYAGQPNSATFFRRADIRLLRDSVLQLGALQIVGRDDRTNPRRKPLADLCHDLDPQRYTILLDHQPYHLEEAEAQGIDFQLSGHTHHGQVWPLSWVTDALYECAYGAWQRGATRYYVSSGLGIWGGKFRIGTCSEYVVAELQQEQP